MTNDCYWRNVADSTSKEGLIFQKMNRQIDFNKCRTYCPLDPCSIGDDGCANYLSIHSLHLEEAVDNGQFDKEWMFR